jgi:hypothetical protein
MHARSCWQLLCHALVQLFLWLILDACMLVNDNRVTSLIGGCCCHRTDLGDIEVFIRELDDNLEIRELRKKITALQEDQAAREGETRHLPLQKELEVLANTIHKDITEKTNQVNQKIGMLTCLQDQVVLSTPNDIERKS